MASRPEQFWTLAPDAALAALASRPGGLSAGEATERLERHGPNVLRAKRGRSGLGTLLSQFRSPLVLILIAAAILSLFLHDPTDAAIILIIVLASGLLGFWQEHGAQNAVDKLVAMVRVRASVLRDGAAAELPVETIVPGDVVELSAGAMVPADGLVLEATALFVDEAALTGETMPAEKAPSALPAGTPLARRSNALFMGTHVVSGYGLMLVAATGRASEFGAISERLRLRPPETDFERGLRRLGNMLMQVTLIMLAVVFGINVFLQRPVVDAFLFALALAVGITPQLLPAIVTINLSRGARRLAAAHVIVKRLFSIENFGRMDVLCSDKTGTLTVGSVEVEGAYDPIGQPSDEVQRAAFVNASLQAGFVNPIDAAIRASAQFDLSRCRKLGEIPYDFVRKRLGIAVDDENGPTLISKGAVTNVLAACTTVLVRGQAVRISDLSDDIEARIREFSAQGLRTIGVATRRGLPDGRISPEIERDMTFLGLITLKDPVKQDAGAAVEDLRSLGVALKIISGDHRLVAEQILQELESEEPVILTGSEIRSMSDEALIRRVEDVTCFAEVEPNQKERIIRTLQKAGHVVGFMGDGINDASALHAADVGLSVDTAVDVAKEAADLVLLDKSLTVIGNGIREGRRTFANTLKYILIAVGANFGNVFSMASASLVLPFLPLLPKQILLANLLTDLPAITIATDNVDAEIIGRPRHWDIAWIRKFMWTFGPLSSAFDFLTFAVLAFVFHAPESQFRTGWFVESVVSAVVIMLLLRSRRTAFESRPSHYFLGASITVALASICLPYVPGSELVGLVQLPLPILISMLAIVFAYAWVTEIVKRRYFQLYKL